MFWTTLWLIATSGVSRVLEYSIRYSTEYDTRQSTRAVKSSIRTALGVSDVRDTTLASPSD